MKKSKGLLSILIFLLSACSTQTPTPTSSDELPGYDYVLTGKQKGVGKNILTLLKTCPPYQLKDLMNDQFHLYFSPKEMNAKDVEQCLDRLRTNFEIQKNLIYRVDPVVKPGKRSH